MNSSFIDFRKIVRFLRHAMKNVRSSALDTGDSAKPRISFGRFARLVRPLILTVLAAAAFAMLLRYHHARFEQGLVRGFQDQQMDAAQALAASLEDQGQSIQRELSPLATLSGGKPLKPTMQEALLPWLERERALVRQAWVLDSAGQELWRWPAEGQAGEPAANVFRLRLPIVGQAAQAGELYADINLHALLLNCQPRMGGASKASYWLLSETGVIGGGDGLTRRRQVMHVRRNADGPNERVAGVDMLGFIRQRCISSGGCGLAEVRREQDKVEELVAFTPVHLHGRRLGLVAILPRADISVPIASHERVTYTMIAALALLYFGTGYATYRSEYARRQLEQHRRVTAEQAAKAKGDFLAHMSHELRTPMNGVIGMTDLAMNATNKAEQLRHLAVVKDCANSLLGVINDILDLSKIEAGRFDLCPILFNVPQCVSDTLMGLAPLAERKGLTLTWEFQHDVPAILHGDAVRLRQILVNLVGNAIKFTKTGGIVVRAALEAAGREKLTLRFAVQDSGPGISRADQERLFEPYGQAGPPGVYRKDSTGLGLAICRQLVKRMNGRIWIDSQIGQGTTISFTATLAAATRRWLDAELSGCSLAGVRILLVSRRPQALSSLLVVARLMPAHVQVVSSCQAALELLRQRTDESVRWNLVILDAPDLDQLVRAQDAGSQEGPALAQLMQAASQGRPAALVVAYTGQLRRASVMSLPTAVDAHVSIPANHVELEAAMKLALQHAATRAPSRLQEGPAAQAALRILLVEDNPVNQQAVSLLLQRWGHHVELAGSGEEALGVWATKEFDLVLMDLEMPGMNGLETSAEIRRREETAPRRTPIVAMTAHAMESDRQRCLAAGMDGYIPKPFRPEDLRAQLANLAGGGAGKALPQQRPAAPRGQPSGQWDSQALLRVTGGNAQAAQRLLVTFLDDLHNTLPPAREAMANRDWQALRAMAHRWKSGFAAVGAAAAAALTEQLETECRAGIAEPVVATFGSLQRELQAVERLMTIRIQGVQSCASW